MFNLKNKIHNENMNRQDINIKNKGNIRRNKIIENNIHGLSNDMEMNQPRIIPLLFLGLLAISASPIVARSLASSATIISFWRMLLASFFLIMMELNSF